MPSQRKVLEHPTTIRLSREVREAIDVQALHRRQSRSALIMWVLEQWLAHMEKQK